MTRSRKFALAVFALVVWVAAPRARANDIVFTGDAGGTAQIGFNVLVPAFHQFSLSNAPLNSLTIGGTSVPFAGTLNIQAVGLTQNSDALLFSDGSLTVSGSGKDEVSASTLTGALGILNGELTFVGFLDPTKTFLQDLLGNQGQLLAGIGLTQIQVALPQLSLPSVDFTGAATASAVALQTVPEPSTLLLLGSGLAAVLLRKRRA